MNLSIAPDRTEASEYFFRYISQVPAGNILSRLEEQIEETMSLLGPLTEEDSHYRYAPGKWSIREIVGHVNDCERVFASRALWFARSLGEELPGFDQEICAVESSAGTRSLESHLEEFNAVRLASLSLYEGLSPDAWGRRGTAGGNPFSVRALAWITTGHLIHHLAGLREHYLQPVGAASRRGAAL